MSNSSSYRFSGSAGRVTVTQADEYGGETEIGTVRTHGRRMSSADILRRLGVADDAEPTPDEQPTTWGPPQA